MFLFSHLYRMELSEFYDFASRGQSPEVFARWMLLPTELAAVAGELDAFNHALEYVVRGGVSLAGYRGRGNRTLFDAAARGGNAGIVSILLERGAQPDISVVSCTVYSFKSKRIQPSPNSLLKGGKFGNELDTARSSHPHCF